MKTILLRLSFVSALVLAVGFLSSCQSDPHPYYGNHGGYYGHRGGYYGPPPGYYSTGYYRSRNYYPYPGDYGYRHRGNYAPYYAPRPHPGRGPGYGGGSGGGYSQPSRGGQGSGYGQVHAPRGPGGGRPSAARGGAGGGQSYGNTRATGRPVTVAPTSPPPKEKGSGGGGSQRQRRR